METFFATGGIYLFRATGSLPGIGNAFVLDYTEKRTAETVFAIDCGKIFKKAFIEMFIFIGKYAILSLARMSN